MILSLSLSVVPNSLSRSLSRLLSDDSCNDPRRLIYGADSRSFEMCGLGANAGRHKLFFPFPENPVARRMCVSECPGKPLRAQSVLPPSLLCVAALRLLCALGVSSLVCFLVPRP